MPKIADELRSMYERKILLDVYLSQLERKENYEAVIAKRTGVGRKIAHRALRKLVDADLLETENMTASVKGYGIAPKGLVLLMHVMENKRSMKYFASSSTKF